MKKLLLLILSLISTITFSQVTTSPSIPTVNDAITVTFDATGSGLAGYTGTVYAHTAVTINGTRWQNIIGSWGNNTTQPSLTRIGTDLYQLNITPDVTTYYNVTSGTVSELDFVFRSADGTKQTSPDIFVTIYTAGLNVLITSQNNNDAFDLNTTQTISADASLASTLKLYVDNVLQTTATSAKTTSVSYTFSTTGSHTIKATATINSTTVTDEVSVFVKSTTQTASIPVGMKNGINKNNDGSVTFVLTAPNKTDVFVLGEFNSWLLNETYHMKKDTTTNQFWVTISGLNPDTEYAYQFDVDYGLIVADPFGHKILDPANDKFIPATTYPNIKPYPTDSTTGIVSTFKITNPTFSWDTFTPPAKNNLIIYELLLRDFDVVGTSDIGDYNKAITHLDYLKNLGVNAIELMPVSEFEGNDSWGYNPSFHGALDKAYGTPTDFKTFINECHKRGMAVIMDVVYNHVMGSSPLAQMWWDSANNRPSATNPYLNPIPKHDFNVGNDFNHESAYTKTYVKETLQYWLQEYKIDGFRFDLAKGFTQNNTLGNISAWGNYDASRITILEDYANFIWSVNNNAYDILEEFADNSEETVLANYGMLLWGNLNNNYAQNTMGFSSSSDISWISYKARGWNNPNVVGYMESHDEERLMYKNLQFGNSNGTYNIKDLATALKREELAANFFFTIPGPKMIWQFGELGYDISINQGGRTSRKPIHWDYFNDANRKNVYDIWRTLTAFKQQQPVFNTTNFTLNVSNLVKNIVLRDASMDVVLVGNFDVISQNVSPNFTKTGTWYEYYTGSSLNVTNTSMTLNLQPGEYRLYSSVPLSNPLGIVKVNNPLNQTLKIYPNPVQTSFRINQGVESVKIYDLTGRLIKQFNGQFIKNKSFDIQALAPSIYLLQIKTTNDKIYAKKLVKY
ncbi:alpha-amylase family glycosyl hydrolase [Lutibacter sp.]|uniref:alpha-amylase family glycosyl hydrolase n=1 Tax=Lutibacter sp. TaxID=1925666 RepID=UPI0025BBDA04|nr:alpha-amylase family glycosyl hydrolase [Lutibacter sp.]MCF6182029.1 T9SS type A sorting domain-containing protein [Lutibacter sp.]